MSESSKNSDRIDWRFWLITLSALAMASLTFSMGIWQLDRAAQKEKISQARREAKPLALTGQWLGAQTQYVDNRQMKAKQGFFVVTPLLTSSTEYVLVERGWIGRNFMDRKQLQPIETPSGQVHVTVRQLPDPIMPAVIAHNVASELPIVQYIRVASFGNLLPTLAYKGYVQQLGSTSEGLQRDWYEPARGVEKHYGYAFQWFALCTLLVALYIWFQWIKK